ncbi:hypothetical protein [Wolbachia endosymbiont (group A) of Longitarsus flavicornis]|uniref:hypothetical protein n=1 Tax=Wolbachia endosymbiont (group A) of Longitarsus flavicornis TaxID=3066134 RepID=UPI0030CA3D48
MLRDTANESRYDGSRRYDVEAILLYSPTQYPIWIPVSGHWDDIIGATRMTKKGTLG